MLLKAGAGPVLEPDLLFEKYNTTPLGVAARLVYGQPSAIGVLLDLCRENWPMKTKGLALNRAAENWKVDNIRFLLSRCFFDEDMLDSALTQVPPKVCVRDPTESELSAQSQPIKLLMTAGSDPSASLRYLSRPLLTQAAAHKHLHECLEALLDNGADPNAVVNPQGQTALHYLAVKEQKEVQYWPKEALARPEEAREAAFRTFFRFNASILQQDVFGNTPFHFAAFTSDLKALQLMLSNLPTELERKAALMLRNHQGESLLHFSSSGAQIDIVEYLLSQEVGISVDEVTLRTWTPFLSALAPVSTTLRLVKIKTAQLLVDHDANPTVITHGGWTALHCLALKHDRNEDDGVLVDSRARFASDGFDLDLPWRRRDIRGISYGCSELRYLEDPKLWGRVV
ncbi:ankyrin repeat-containing domain protein [Fusarium venenatum]|uniref:ankyrin repeat-containing domain protein n=1 Tax=Fusarium venenatum TaxID=56646 RepID=UPI001DAE8510|nr:ankyrin repeat-containing domain protein [Fusarium venenatum]